MTETEALLIVDYTNDFIAPAGALTVGAPGQALLPRIQELATDFIARDQFVFFPTDKHFAGDHYHPESKLYPPHNLARTSGRKLYGSLASWLTDHENDPRVRFFDKFRYSAFVGTPLDLWLRERQVTTVHLAGVCTDICVLHTAIGAVNHGYQLVVHKDAVASFNPAGHKWALDHMERVLNATMVPG